MKNNAFHSGLWLTILFISACSHPLSKEARLSIDPDAYFELAREHPNAYKGKTFLLGGLIVANKTTQEVSILEVLSYDLDFQDKPTLANEKNGRFLARNQQFLDPALYQKDRLVTLTGTLTGQETQPLNGGEYTYPVFEVEEIYLWPKKLNRDHRSRYYRYPHHYYPHFPYHPYYPYRRYPYYRYW